MGLSLLHMKNKSKPVTLPLQVYREKRLLKNQSSAVCFSVRSVRNGVVYHHQWRKRKCFTRHVFISPDLTLPITLLSHTPTRSLSLDLSKFFILITINSLITVLCKWFRSIKEVFCTWSKTNGVIRGVIVQNHQQHLGKIYRCLYLYEVITLQLLVLIKLRFCPKRMIISNPTAPSLVRHIILILQA